MTKAYDAIVVGARCAGAATAMLLARASLNVLVVDHDHPGGDTMSTHALMRAGVMQLHRWGLIDAIRRSGVQPVKETSFFYSREQLTVEIKPTPYADALYAPRRYVLDTLLAEAAAKAGAMLRYRQSCCGLIKGDDGRVIGVRLKGDAGRVETATADLVIGADGRRSTVARLAETPTLAEARSASAVLYAYFQGIENRGYRWYWAPGVAGGIIPTNGGQSCVFLALPAQRVGALRGKSAHDLVAAAHALLPTLREHLAGAVPCSAPVVFAGQHGRVRQASGSGWALVGDAGYFKDPISAHGITDALRDAELLARAILAGNLDAYARMRAQLSGPFFDITERLAAFDWDMDELAELHRALHEAMKPEQAWAEHLPAPPARQSPLPARNLRLAT
jgi:flavin-dependent dehydrogenase